MSKLAANPKLKDQLKAEWLPTIAWVRQGPEWSTKLAFAPAMVTTGEDIFTMDLRFFHRGQFVGTFKTKQVRYPQVLRVNVEDALKELNLNECDGIAEVIVSGEGAWSAERRIKCIFDVWMEIQSAGGKFRVVGPTGQFVGSNRVRLASNNALETYPGVPVNASFSTDILLMNPYTIPIWAQVSAFNCRGEKMESARKSVPKQNYLYMRLDEIVSGVAKHAEPEGCVSLVIESQYKLVAYCLFRDTQTMEVTALDHTWPFLELRREPTKAKST